ncbi:MAG: hypothetical protein KDJ39_00870 [Gammaproteobacteria bacterium]|nr:hypothetical protein [Gammaproteobacteria bacterium]
MSQRDWQRADDYAFTAHLDAAQWAWEFLRRNPAYRAEWQAFDAVWRALEGAYGRPPDRDFCAWKRDPRAWVPASECAHGECRVDHGKVLIECALGARWGFHKFPPDPDDDDAATDARLTWRPLDETQPLVETDDGAWLGDDPARVALGFDLSQPLPEQLERAKRSLQVLQRQRVKTGRVRPATVAAWRDDLQVMLRLLDAQQAGIDDARLAVVADDWSPRQQEAQGLRDGGYRMLARLRD